MERLRRVLITGKREVSKLSYLQEVVRRRLEEKVERGKLIPHNQTGFKEKAGAVDSIYVI